MDDLVPRSILILCLIVAGALFSAGETALSYCNGVRIRIQADDGSRRAKRAVRLLDEFDETVVALLIGVNILHVAAAAVSAVLFTELLGAKGAGISTVVMTLLIFIFSETIPKSIANANSDAVILAMAGMIRFFSVIFRPLVFVLTRFGEFCRKLIHIDDAEPTYTEDELAAMVEDVESDGLLEETESDIIQSSIEFSDIPARRVMTSRSNIVALPDTAGSEELRRVMVENKFSRFPVYHGDLDHIVGILVAKKCLYRFAHGENVTVTEMMEPPLLLSASLTGADVFKEMQRRKTHFAILQTPDGRTAGGITMDDILDELVDEIDEISAVSGEGDAV